MNASVKIEVIDTIDSGKRIYQSVYNQTLSNGTGQVGLSFIGAVDLAAKSLAAVGYFDMKDLIKALKSK